MSLLVREILNIGEGTLEKAGIFEFKNDARELYAYMMKIEKSKIVLEYQSMLDDKACEEYFGLIDARASGKPLQYITEKAYFMGLEFFVNSDVLIPRQDTEVLVEEVLNIVKDNSCKDVLDLCTGSGAIGISVANFSKKINMVCADISQEALKVAEKNSNEILGGGKIKFVKGDMLEPFLKKMIKKKIDMIISNPPYIRSEIIETLDRTVKDYEPLLALDGGEDGLDFYRRLITDAPKILRKRGYLVMEIGYDQREEIFELLKGNTNYVDYYCLQDLGKNDRVIIARVG